MNSLVSIIVPAYNAESFISQTLQSVMGQSYINWECLVIDDGSTDETAKVVQQLGNSDKRIHYFYKKNSGLSEARNYGLIKSRGVYIQFLDSDDVLFPEKLTIMVNMYRQSSKNGMILFSDFIYSCHDDPYAENKSEFKLFNDFRSKDEIRQEYIYKGWDYKITIPIHCFLFPTQLINEIYFDEKIKSKEDWNFHLAVLNDEKKFFQAINYIGCAYRVTNNSMSKDYTSMIESSLLILKKWKKSYHLFTYRVSFYILQAYIYKVKGKEISLKKTFELILNLENSNVGLLVGSHLCLPITIFFKVVNSIRIRAK